MSIDPLMAQTGMEVYGSDAEPVGRVRDVSPTGILVTRPDDKRAADIFIPREYLDQVSEPDYRVDLNITGAQARQLDEGTAP